MELSALDWDTDYFGVRSARFFIGRSLEEEEFKTELHELKKYQFVTIVNSSNDASNNFAIGKYTNAFLVDINIQFQKKIARGKAETNYSAENNYDFNQEIVKIAENTFNYSRFYNDPYLDENLAGRIYGKWVENSFNRESKYFITAEENGQVAGFLLFSISQEQLLEIELVSILPSLQGKGTGAKLMASLEAFAVNNGYGQILVGTQIDNIQAISFYSKRGYQLAGKNAVYHYWPEMEG